MNISLISIVIAFLLVDSASSLVAQEKVGSPAQVVEQEMLRLLSADVLHNFEGSTVVSYRKKVIFPPNDVARKRRAQFVRELSERMEANPNLRLSPELAEQLEDHSNTPEFIEHTGSVTLDFQDISRWRLTNRVETSSDKYRAKADLSDEGDTLVADGTGFVFSRSGRGDDVRLRSGSAGSQLVTGLNEYHPYSALLRFLPTEYANDGSQAWSVEQKDGRLLVLIKVGLINPPLGPSDLSIFEFRLPDMTLDRITQTHNDTHKDTWTRIDAQNWTFESEAKNPNKVSIFKCIVNVRITHSNATKFPVSTFASPLHPGGKVKLASRGGEIELPADAFIQRKVKFEDIQNVFRAEIENSALNSTIDGAAQRIDDIKTLPSEVKKPLKDAADGAKKLLKGGDAASQESAPVTPQ